MSKNSILLISSDSDVSEKVAGVLGGIEDAAVTREDASVAKLNGAAVKMASEHDVVIFATNPDNAADLAAIETLTEQRKPNSVFLALTDADLPLSKARALSKAGVDDVLPYPVSDSELTDQVDQWLQKRRAAIAEQYSGANAKTGTVFSIAQARGGIGSTTVAVNLADQLLNRKGTFKKEAGNKVVLVDLDLQFGTVGDFLDLEPQEGLMQLAVENFAPDVQWVEQSLAHTPNGLAVLAAPEGFAPLDAFDDEQIAALIDTLKMMFDYIVVDMPRALVSWVEPVMSRTDKLLIVSDMTVPSVRATRRLMDFVLADNTELQVEVVINHEKKPMMLREHHKEASKALDAKFNHWIADDPKAAREAVDLGKPVSEVAGRSDLAKGAHALAKALMTEFPKDKASAKVRV